MTNAAKIMLALTRNEITAGQAAALLAHECDAEEGRRHDAEQAAARAGAEAGALRLEVRQLKARVETYEDWLRDPDAELDADGEGAADHG